MLAVFLLTYANACGETDGTSGLSKAERAPLRKCVIKRLLACVMRGIDARIYYIILL